MFVELRLRDLCFPVYDAAVLGLLPGRSCFKIRLYLLENPYIYYLLIDYYS
jgi:hypothetical protein